MSLLELKEIKKGEQISSKTKQTKKKSIWYSGIHVTTIIKEFKKK
jgi:hypothetical protein